MMLVCKELVKRYHNKLVVDHASLELEEGRIYALLGQNGSGKSTLMKMITGLVKGEQGDILYKGTGIGVLSKREIAYMPTESYFYDYMRVKDVEQYYTDFFQDFNKDRFYNLISKLELDQMDKIKHLSTGQNAKLRLAATLAREAKLYLLDEPLNGIDLISRDLITTTILEVSSEDNIIVISSHLIDEIEKIVDHIILLDKGQIKLIGDAEEIREEHGKSIVDIYREVLA